MRNRIIILLLGITFTLSAYSQEMLRLSDAVQITLENDYNIKVAEKSADVAQNNSSVLANQYLPQVSAASGASFSNSNTNTDYTDGTNLTVDGKNTVVMSASLGLSYTLFDGMYRSYNFEKSKQLYNLSQLQVRQVIETTLFDLFSKYYTVANLTESTASLQQTLDISKIRLLRVGYGLEYGESTQLDFLNAQVDVNTDSINLLNSNQSLANAKRNLNVLMGRDVTTSFLIDTTVIYQALYSLDTLLSKAQDENIRLLTTQKTLEMRGIDIKLYKTNRVPTIGLSAYYGWSNTNNNDKSSIDMQNIVGPTAELSLAWNIFDGGSTRIGVQNARIAVESQMIQQEQTSKEVERDVINAYSTYKNSLFVMEAEKANLVTNQRNFERSVEQYKLGQLASVDFRQAQLNLLRAETKYNQSKYQAKIYELALNKLTGDLLNMEF